MHSSIRASYAASGSSQAVSAAATSKLLEKKKEYDAVCALERASSLFLERIEGLGEDFNVTADAGQVHGQVLEQWPKMFQILNLFLASRSESGQNEGTDNVTLSPLEGQRLVRIPIDELQAAAEKQSS